MLNVVEFHESKEILMSAVVKGDALLHNSQKYVLHSRSVALNRRNPQVRIRTFALKN